MTVMVPPLRDPGAGSPSAQGIKLLSTCGLRRHRTKSMP
ncbi:protein of unknown function [Legionella micdadei]|uniref:Uncharacterized protein n=1 Tax=Legionella micdadei TaxID=451 RepID=A0A098GBA1_LEGMI|nr:protein of unknown function [Legionella micdadei]